jgi:enediyne biosynthesis protein CalE5
VKELTMSNVDFDLATYKAEQDRDWTRTAGGWRDHDQVSERQWRRVSQGLLQRVKVGPGQRMLDVATGIGEPALTAAGVVAPGGRVVGTDLSAEMIGIARQRARDQGLGNVEFHVADADAGQQPGSGYDAAVCRWALMFFADPRAALRGVRRVLKRGGWLAASTVGRPDCYLLVTTVAGAICAALGLPPPPPPPPGQPGFFSLCDPGVLRATLTGAGFADVDVERFELVYEFDSGERLADWQFAISAPVNALLAQRPEGRDRARQAVARAAEEFRHPDGVIRFPPSENWYAVGRNPR